MTARVAIEQGSAFGWERYVGTEGAIVAILSRQHNDANVVGLGARMHTQDDATAIVMAFLTTPFSGSARHAHRIAQLAEYEKDRQLPPLP